MEVGGTIQINKNKEDLIMQKKEVKIPNVTLYSEYFKCPRCGWTTDGPRLVRGDIAQCPCEKCGHSYLVRVK